MELALNCISKTYKKGSVKALDNFSVTLTPGVYGLLGPNGAGKSTLMNIITDNLNADGGEVVYGGENIKKLGKDYRAVLGYMPQQQGLYDDFTLNRFLWYMAALKGLKKKEAKEIFWNLEHDLVKKKYPFQSIIGINKLTSSYLIAAVKAGTKIEKREDNYIVRVNVPDVKPELMEMKDNSGYFFEYDCDDLMNIRDFCNNTHCQTIGYLGDKEAIMQLLQSGIKGVDRVVPIGKTMDFDFIWDGYNLVERLTRTIKVSI